MVPELNEFAGLPMAAENPPNVTPAVKPSATTAASAAASPRRSARTCLVSRISPPTASGLPHLHDGGGPHPRAPLERPPGCPGTAEHSRHGLTARHANLRSKSPPIRRRGSQLAQSATA